MGIVVAADVVAIGWKGVMMEAPGIGRTIARAQDGRHHRGATVKWFGHIVGPPALRVPLVQVGTNGAWAPYC